MEAESFFLITAVVWMRFRKGHSLTMLSDGQRHVLNSGQSVFLECSFRADDYNLFDYPVIWKKQQHDETVQMNVMGSLNEPFVSNNRFEVSFNAKTAPRYLFELNVIDIVHEDSGNYTCEIRGPHSVLLGHVTHQLFVRAHVEKIRLLDDNASENEDDDDDAFPTAFHLVENHPSRIRCISLGGYPPPRMELYIGHREVTYEFTFRNNVTLSGPRGIRTMTYRTERSANNYLPRADDNDQLMRCIALVPGLNPVIEITTLDVDFSPKILCRLSAAFLWQKDVTLRCEVRSKPPTSGLFWLIDNETAIREGETVNNFDVHVRDRLDGSSETLLNLQRVQKANFRRYTVVAENSVGIASKDVDLIQKIKSAEAGSLADVPSVSHVSSRETSRDNIRTRSGSRSKMSASDAAAVYGLKVSLVVSLILKNISGFSCHKILVNKLGSNV